MAIGKSATGLRLILVVVLSGLAVLAACREQEENRPIKLEKGVYQGRADTPLSEDTIKALRQRGLEQGAN